VCGNEMPLGAAPSAGLPLPPASRARKVPMRESGPTLWKQIERLPGFAIPPGM
jgi:hypothetical protein